MSGYVRATQLEGLQFQGEPVTGTIEQLSLPDLLKLEGSNVETDRDAAAVLAQIVPAYVKNFSGPKAADGSPVPIEEVCAKAYFLELAMDIGRRLVSASRPPQKPSEISGS